NEWSDARALDVAALYVNEVCKVLLLQNKNPTTYAEFKKFFLDHYQNNEYKTRNYNAAHNYRQSDSESADAFIVKMMRWFERADIHDDATQCRLFSNAANESVLRSILRKSPKTFAEMIALAQAEDHVTQVIADRRRNQLETVNPAPSMQDFRAPARSAAVPPMPAAAPAVSVAMPSVSVAVPAAPRAARNNVDVNDLISQM
ncbi:hypothetical protein CPB97_006059, partial [Podila verticillata]